MLLSSLLSLSLMLSSSLPVILAVLAGHLCHRHRHPRCPRPCRRCCPPPLSSPSSPVVVVVLVCCRCCCCHHQCRCHRNSFRCLFQFIVVYSSSLPSSLSSPSSLSLSLCHCRLRRHFFLCRFWLIVVCDPRHCYPPMSSSSQLPPPPLLPLPPLLPSLLPAAIAADAIAIADCRHCRHGQFLRDRPDTDSTISTYI